MSVVLINKCLLICYKRKRYAKYKGIIKTLCIVTITHQTSPFKRNIYHYFSEIHRNWTAWTQPFKQGFNIPFPFRTSCVSFLFFSSRFVISARSLSMAPSISSLSFSSLRRRSSVRFRLFEYSVKYIASSRSQLRNINNITIEFKVWMHSRKAMIKQNQSERFISISMKVWWLPWIFDSRSFNCFDMIFLSSSSSCNCCDALVKKYKKKLLKIFRSYEHFFPFLIKPSKRTKYI